MRRYRLLPNGYRICVLFLKVFERVYASVTAGLLRPITADAAARRREAPSPRSPSMHLSSMTWTRSGAPSA
jgi:hypothetical protein